MYYKIIILLDIDALEVHLKLDKGHAPVIKILKSLNKISKVKIK
jgi:hypothetical protein